MEIESRRVIAFCGNPNVGKTTLYNRLTGKREHTGNWTGKTVGCAKAVVKGTNCLAVDLPGTYSLDARSPEEGVTRDFLNSGEANAAVIVCDASSLERNLILALSVANTGIPSVMCLNLIDEARRGGTKINTNRLSELVGMPVAVTCATNGSGVRELIHMAKEACLCERKPTRSESAEELTKRAADICAECVSNARTRDSLSLFDRIVTGKLTAFPVMALFMTLLFWLTIKGANYPSELLSKGLGQAGLWLRQFFEYIGAPYWLCGVICDGLYGVSATVVSVMLPPMAVFFPLFTLLEDAGFLPRLAFNLDRCFCSCRTCGKQALTMCMGFGCNAAGVTGCRIIDTPRERLCAILTNSFVPCNGRFPSMITLISVFFAGSSALRGSLILAGTVLLGVVSTLLATGLLSSTLLKGKAGAFALELPPYRRPDIGRVIVRSLFDRTAFVLGRALCVAAPAGVLIWLLANVQAGDASLLKHFTEFLDPAGRLLGLDGVMLGAFIIALPANELVLPVALMAYTSASIPVTTETAAVAQVLYGAGWTGTTALCALLFILLHWPCSTTLLTIRREAGGWRWALLAAVLPTVFGAVLCIGVNLISCLL